MTSDCHDHKACLEMFEKLSEYLDHELDNLTCADIEKHAGECISCKVCLETLKRTIEVCKHMEFRTVPASFTARLKDAIGNIPQPDGAQGPGRK